MGNLFFIIRSGEVLLDVGSQEKKEVMLKKGDFFGDLALIYATPRSGSAKSRSAC